MKTSAAGRALITQREGRKLTAYRDPKGIWTIGVGHVDMTPPKVTPGMTITESQCDAMLAADLGQVEGVINFYVKVPISQNEFDAMASLGFNIGADGLRRSSVIKRLNLGDVAGAAQAFMLWDHPAVLEGRRAEERSQFLAPDLAGSGGIGRSQEVATARAQSLHARAAKIKDDAKATRVAGASAALVGTAGGGRVRPTDISRRSRSVSRSS